MDGDTCVKVEFTITHMVRKKATKISCDSYSYYMCLYKGEYKDLPGQVLSLQGALASK